jgi:hypothetical protein
VPIFYNGPLCGVKQKSVVLVFFVISSLFIRQEGIFSGRGDVRFAGRPYCPQMRDSASPVGRIYPKRFQPIIAAAVAGMLASLGLSGANAGTARISNLNMMVWFGLDLTNRRCDQ